MNRLKRIIGRGIYTFAKHFPESHGMFGIPKRIRAFCGKLILSKCGDNINIEKNAVFASSVELGSRSGLGINCRISGKTIIGNDVMMGPNVSIYTQNHLFNRIDIPMNKQGNTKESPVIIGDDVWIGANTIILPGVKISRGGVIGAGSVVTKNVPEYAVVAGNPAKIIKYRYESEKAPERG